MYLRGVIRGGRLGSFDDVVLAALLTALVCTDSHYRPTLQYMKSTCPSTKHSISHFATIFEVVVTVF